METSRIRRATALLFAMVALVVTATPVAAATPQAATALRAQCLADGGTYAVGRGFIRCQQASTDGMGVFWAESQVCERAYGTFFVTSADPTAPAATGGWLCSIT